MRSALTLPSPSAAAAARVGHVEPIRDRARVRDILRALAGHGAGGLVRRDRATAPVRVERCDDDVLLLGCRTPVAPPFAVELGGYNAVFEFITGDARWVEGRLEVPVPEALVRVRRRWLRRHDATRPLTATCDAPAMPAFHGRVTNLSHDGLALHALAPLAEEALGTRLQGLVVSDGWQAAEIDAELRSVHTVAHGRGRRYGLEVTRSDRRWALLVGDQLYPRTALGSAHNERIWALFARSGYFDLSGRSPAAFERLRDAYFGFNRALDRAPRLGRACVWRAGDEVVATAAMTRIYRGTFLGYQLAKVGGDAPDGTPGRRVLGELMFRLYEEIQQEPDLRWFVTYVQTKEVWTRYAFVDAARAYVSSGDAALVRFRALELATAPRGRGGPRWIAAASARERELVAEHVIRTRGAAYADAFDLGRDSIHFADTRRLWQREDLARDRAVLVARDEGRAVAAAVIEHAAPGAHLYNLLDIVRLYTLAPGGEHHFAGLLELARAWFRELGCATMTLLQEDDVSLSPELRAQAVDLGTADMVVFAARRIPELLETLYQLTAPRP